MSEEKIERFCPVCSESYFRGWECPNCKVTLIELPPEDEE